MIRSSQLLHVVLCLLALFLLQGEAEDETAAFGEMPRMEIPYVEVKQGTMKGALMMTAKGRPVAAYRGIPYAQPPIRELRFRAPRPAEKWANVLDATAEAPPCIQKEYLIQLGPSIIGQEDCLYLNVYVPLELLENMQSAEEQGEPWEKKIPVMVFIHGGGFTSGSGGGFNWGPQRLLDKDVILVTMNYRLSAFGFLSTGDRASPGNYGLKDQALALKWVKNNIASFGGDKKKVTIFGHSAGGASVHYHILSPMSKGLFQNAIAQSGDALAPWALARDAPGHAKTLAEFVDCPTDKGSVAMVNCLRWVDAERITEQFEKFLKWTIDPMLIFCPTLESKGNDEKPFITDHPYNLMKKGKFNPVNLIAGITSEDGALRTAAILSVEQSAKEINEEFIERVGPLALRLEETASDPKEASKRIRQFYFGEKDIDIKTHKELTDLFTDRILKNSLKLSLELLVNAPTSKPVYYYEFSHRGKYSFLDAMPMKNKTTNGLIDWGVGHCDELTYLFPHADVLKGPLNDDDIHISDVMVKMWTDFANLGDPTPARDELIPLQWQPIKPNEMHFLNIGTKGLEMLPMSEEYIARFNFWESLKLKENEHYVSEKLKDEL
ncbi:juvenile hormone esterase-like [Ischnura elegans]|uniref:juvenile hormone esterase-like n=1 Tax=Ischnura elegans TaxID=197161 RepID=UPI001ED87F8B|nr:juvenile hormone esterase-like [Ischnura elegans]